MKDAISEHSLHAVPIPRIYTHLPIHSHGHLHPILQTRNVLVRSSGSLTLSQRCLNPHLSSQAQVRVGKLASEAGIAGHQQTKKLPLEVGQEAQVGKAPGRRHLGILGNTGPWHRSGTGQKDAWPLPWCGMMPNHQGTSLLSQRLGLQEGMR